MSCPRRFADFEADTYGQDEEFAQEVAWYEAAEHLIDDAVLSADAVEQVISGTADAWTVDEVDLAVAKHLERVGIPTTEERVREELAELPLIERVVLISMDFRAVFFMSLACACSFAAVAGEGVLV